MHLNFVQGRFLSTVWQEKRVEGVEGEEGGWKGEAKDEGRPMREGGGEGLRDGNGHAENDRHQALSESSLAPS